MNAMVKEVTSKLEVFLQESSKKRIAKKLMRLSDEQLSSLKVSRVELQKGSGAYPWTCAA